MTYLNASQLGVLGVLVYSHRCCASKEVLKQLKNVKVKNIDCTALAWAVVSQNGEVFTWGMPCSGGDSRDVQDRLQNVTKVVASHAAFAALWKMDQWFLGVIHFLEAMTLKFVLS